MIDQAVVAGLNQDSAGERAERNALGVRIRKSTCEQEPQVLFGGDDVLRRVGRIRRDDHFGEDLDDLFGGLGIEGRVERDDAAKGADAVAGKRLPIGLGQCRRDGDATRVRMFDDRDGGRGVGIELGDQLEGGVRIVEIVVGEFLALDLPGGGDAGALLRGPVERGPLMWILAIT